VWSSGIVRPAHLPVVALRTLRRFLMDTQGLSEDEAISLMSVGVDFGITQVVDGNWGVHAILKKSLFAGAV
jgi:acetamidase/formamidase